MIICFNCSLEVKERLERLVQTGGYQDYTSAISSAITNLLLLEEQIAESGAVVLNEPIASLVRSSSGSHANGSGADTQHHSVFAPFVCPSFQSKPTLAPDLATVSGPMVRPDEWIFGQYNKLLPVKVNCRLIANLLHQSPSGVSMQAVVGAVQQDMPALREWLSQYDAQHSLERESALATAFPTKETKSLLRYSNQFVLNVNKGGVASGLPVDLGLLQCLDAKGTRVSLTGAGLHLALLQNPVLDPPQRPDQRLSKQERGFLLTHIRASVPREHSAYVTLIRAMESGADNPSALDEVLRRDVVGGISDPYLSNLRAGAISRMSELGLIARRRQGTRVTYIVTPDGREYINDKEIAGA
jgi:hypothetical protein